MKSGSRPFDDVDDFQVIKRLAEAADWVAVSGALNVKDISADGRTKCVARVLSFVDVSVLRHLRVVVNSGNGMAAVPTFDAIAA
jgi:phosphomannomutase